MLGATVFELYQKWSSLTAANMTTIAVGFVVSFIVAYGVVKTFIDFIGRYGLKPFGWYRVAIGVALLARLALR
jgi:undecaprenyl-diphosphatase